MVTAMVRTPSRASEKLCSLKETVRGILAADFEKTSRVSVLMNGRALSDTELDTPLRNLQVVDEDRIILTMPYKAWMETDSAGVASISYSPIKLRS